MKTCRKCSMAKDLREFYPHPQMRDGHLNFCKTCVKARVRDWYSATIEQRHAFDKNREPRAPRTRNREKMRARGAVARALRTGHLLRQPCARCGAVKVEAHHPDYSKPLDVVWLCFKCHREEEHGQVVTAA